MDPLKHIPVTWTLIWQYVIWLQLNGTSFSVNNWPLWITFKIPLWCFFVIFILLSLLIIFKCGQNILTLVFILKKSTRMFIDLASTAHQDRFSRDLASELELSDSALRSFSVNKVKCKS